MYIRLRQKSGKITDTSAKNQEKFLFIRPLVEQPSDSRKDQHQTKIKNLVWPGES